MSEPSPGEDLGATLAFVVTDPLSARYLLRGQLAYLAARGFNVVLVCSPGPLLDEVRAHEKVPVYEVAMKREIKPFRDLRSLFGLFRLLRRLKPEILSASTPKAGLLGMLAGKMAQVPYRVYTQRGLRLETATGLKASVLRLAERVASHCADTIVCVSPSLEREYLRRRLASADKTLVLGSGSSNGIDVERFRPPAAQESDGQRQALGLPLATPIVGFVGRLVRDKGIEDLARAFTELVTPRFPDARLVLLGDYEAGDPVSQATRELLADRGAVLLPGFVEDTAPWYRAMSVLAFPSFREGFPNAPLEAAASGVPTVGYRATGTRDAILDGETGALVEKGDWQALGERLCDYLGDPRLREKHGAAALERVRRNHSNQIVWRRWADFYSSLSSAGRVA